MYWKNIYWIIVFIVFSSCDPNISQDFFPYIESGGDLILVENPIDNDDIILGVGNQFKCRVDYVLRDCFTNELISCIDSLGQLKKYVILCLGVDVNNLSWDIVNCENLNKYDKNGNEYYLKVWIADDKEINYKKQIDNWNNIDTMEVKIGDPFVSRFILENKKQWILSKKNKQNLSYRLLDFNLLFIRVLD